jgi:hypothetical protein
MVTSAWVLLALAEARIPASAEDVETAPCSHETSSSSRALLPARGESASPAILPDKTRPYRVSGAGASSWSTEPRSAENIICHCAVCEGRWFDGRYAKSPPEPSQVRPHEPSSASDPVPPVRCRPISHARGYLVGDAEGKDLVTVEDPHRMSVLRWLEASTLRVKRVQRADRKDHHLGGGSLASDEGDGVVSGAKVLFTNDVGGLRFYPSKQDLPLAPVRGIFSDEGGRELLQAAGILYRGWMTTSGFAYRRTEVPDDGSADLSDVRISRLWASERWILRSFVPAPTLWMVSRADGTEDRFLAYGHLRECGQPLMDDHVLTIETDERGSSVLVLSLSPDLPDYRVNGAPLDELYCVAGEGGTLAVSGRWNRHPAVAIYDRETWQRILLPDSPSILEPLVQGGRIFVSAPEEAAVVPDGGASIPSVGAVYVLGQVEDQHNDGARWTLRQKVVAPRPRRHAMFGYRLIPQGKRVFVNFLDDYPKAPGMPRPGFGYPSFCEATLD